MSNNKQECFVSFNGVQKSYDGKSLVVKDLNLRIKKGEFITMLGPSGSGKTTCLMMLAGFETATKGEITLDGVSINNIPPHKRCIGMVFQNYALFPHMTVAENLAFPLEVRKVNPKTRKEKIAKSLDMVQMSEFANRRPAQLSGGQQQRIALARCLVFEPQLILMDEPLGALDKQLREHMQYEIRHLHERLGITVVYVTHDQGEALTMSDRVAVFNDGRIQQLAKPVDLYEQPENLFVAQFIGENNQFSGVVKSCNGDQVTVLVDGVQICAKAVAKLTEGSATTLSIRPERISVSTKLPNTIKCEVQEMIYLGDHLRCRMSSGSNSSIIVKIPNSSKVTHMERGQQVSLGWEIEDCRALRSVNIFSTLFAMGREL